MTPKSTNLFFKYIFSLLLLVSSFSSFHAKADHVAGGELVYEWVSDSTYRFYFKFYRFCGGVSEDSMMGLCYHNSCNGYTGGSMMAKVRPLLPDGRPNGQPVAPHCPGIKTRCDFGNVYQAPPVIAGILPDFTEWWYTTTVTLPSRCDHWTFFVSCFYRNRNGNVPGVYNMYTEADLNNSDTSRIFSSPYFTVKPVPYVCLNEPQVYGSGPVDPNRDSMSYEFLQPQSQGIFGSNGGSNGIVPPTPYNCYVGSPPFPIPYRYPYSLLEPFPTGNTFRFDLRTSNMNFTPVQIGNYIVSFRVNKWRQQKLLGSVMRDVQVEVVACTSPPVQLKIDSPAYGARVIKRTSIEACLNKYFTFKYNIVTNVKGTILVATDNHLISIPGSGTVYKNQATDSIAGFFSWLPTDTGNFILTVIVRDSTCRVPGVMIPHVFVIPIHVSGLQQTYHRASVCLGNKVNLFANSDENVYWTVLPGGSPVSTIACPTCQYTTGKPTQNTIYTASYNTINSCSAGDTVDVTVTQNSITIAPASPIILCHPDSIRLIATATGAKPFANLQCGIPPSTPVTFIDTVTLPFNDTLLRNTANPASTPFNGNYVTAHHQYLVKARDLVAAGLYSGTLKSLSFRLSSPLVSTTFKGLTISLKCTTDTLDTSAAFMSGTTLVYTAPPFVPLSGTGGYVKFNFDNLYNWDTTQNLLVDMCYANTGTVPTNFTYFYNTPYKATKYGYNVSGNLCNGGTAIASGILVAQLPAMRFEYYRTPELPFPYLWGNGVFVPSDTISNPHIYIDHTTQIYVTTLGRNGCTPSDTLQILVSDHGYRISPDTAICVGSSVQLQVRDTNIENLVHTYQWTEEGDGNTLSCYNCDNPVATPTSDTRYHVAIANSFNCTDTLSVFIKVNPIPVMHITPADTTIPSNSTIQLQASGTDSYSWMPATTLSNPNIADPEVSPQEKTTYIVTGLKNGCRATDSVTITPDKGGLIFIPNAFTPNGDGKNDEFHVVHLTVEQLDEFRVYNRWGQEVFSTTDKKQGWDGTWKGVPQDLGTYCYLIRVTFPDGTTHSYKGNVTLVR